MLSEACGRREVICQPVLDEGRERFGDKMRAMTWLAYACVSAVAAAATAILAKIGVEGVPSTLATAIRTLVVVAFSWVMVAALGEQRAMLAVSRRSWMFLTLSGLATGISWLAYFRALQLGAASRVAPIDKLSLPLTIVLAAVALGEPMTLRLAGGVALMTIGALLTLG
jgi:transporter family protein